MARLDEAYEAIVDAVVDAIRSDADAGGPLEGVTVVRGDRTRPMPKSPSVWVVPEAATQAPDTYGAEEQWSMPIGIAALVKDDDPDAGRRECVRLAALARRAAIRDPHFGLTYVTDAKSQRFDGATRTSERNRNLFWADATIVVMFAVDE